MDSRRVCWVRRLPGGYAAIADRLGTTEGAVKTAVHRLRRRFGVPVISMELLPGGTLKDRVAAQGPLPPAEAVAAVLEIIGGLDAAQAAGILHRDIKPSNCFVDSDGSVKVGDFGLSISTLARDVREQLGSRFEGTPQFAAPEQLRGEPLRCARGHPTRHRGLPRGTPWPAARRSRASGRAS